METRKPAWAGQFYPQEPAELQNMLQAFFQNTQKTTGDICGIIAPHAGYVYSGQTSAHAYKQLQGMQPKTVVVLAPSHTAFIQGVSFFDGLYYETPLGKIPVAHDAVIHLTEMHSLLNTSPDGHTTHAMRAEHSLEVQLPFLQTMLENFQLVPAVFHDTSWQTCYALGSALADAFDPQQTLIVASSDFYHGESYSGCKINDALAIEAILTADAGHFAEANEEEVFMACGAGPITALMVAAQQWHCEKFSLMHQTNSADVMHSENGYVVGYAGIVVER